MNQTRVQFDMPTSRTNERKRSKSVKIKTTGSDRRGFTVSLGAFANGDKMNAWVIFKVSGCVLFIFVVQKFWQQTNIFCRIR